MKILIIGKTHLPEIVQYISNLDDSLEICYKITNDLKYQNYIIPNKDNVYYMDIQQIELSYKNNSLLYINSTNDGDKFLYNGVTKDDFTNTNLLDLTITEFNKIPNKVLDSEETLLLVWVDYKGKDNKIPTYEYKYFMDRYPKYPNLYFLDDSIEHISNIILEYVDNPEKREQILEEYS